MLVFGMGFWVSGALAALVGISGVAPVGKDTT